MQTLGEASGTMTQTSFLGAFDRAMVVRGFVDAGMLQFTGGAIDTESADGEPALMEVICCRVR